MMNRVQAPSKIFTNVRCTKSPSSRWTRAARKHTAQATAQVVCLGEALFDMLADQKGKSKDEVESWSGYPGGAPCNVAAGLGKLGIPVAFISSLGKDSKGDELFELLADRGVDMEGVKRVDKPTRDVFVIRTMGGDRIFDSFGQDTSSYCDCFIDGDALPVDTIKAAEVMVCGTLGLAYEVTGSAMHKAVDIAKAAGTYVFIDFNWRPVFFPDPSTALEAIMPLVRKADLLKITDEECEFALGINGDVALKNPHLVLEKLPGLTGVLVTAGGDGAAWCVKTKDGNTINGFTPVFSIDVQDTTGAGDAFTCGFLAYMLSEEGKAVSSLLTNEAGMDRAVQFAAACGALTTTSAGAIAAQPLLSDVKELISTAA